MIVYDIDNVSSTISSMLTL